MKTIQLGNKEFQLGELTLETINLLVQKSNLLKLLPSNAEGKTEIGDAILYILIAVFGDEDRAMEEGLKLQETDQKNVTEQQFNYALDVLNEMIDNFNQAHTV